MTTWLVTGGAGFIGGNFVLGAVGDGIRVVNLDALTYAGNRDTLASLDGDANHVFVHGDIGVRALVAKLLAEHRPDAVVNFAAESHVDRSIDGPAAFIQTNVVGTLALLEAVRDHWKSLEGEAKQAFRFLHVSTDEVYGTLGETGKFSETTPYAPNSPYSASKAASERTISRRPEKGFFRSVAVVGIDRTSSTRVGESLRFDMEEENDKRRILVYPVFLK